MKKIIYMVSGIIFGFVLALTSVALSDNRYEKLRIYTQVFNLVEEHFIEKIKVEDMVIASIRGLLGDLDPYSGYLAQKDFKKFKSETDGNFNGIGVELSLKNRRLEISSVIESSPAWEAGILPKDQIVAVNGNKIQALDFIQAVSELEKVKKSNIELSILRPSIGKVLKFKMKRKKIKIDPIKVLKTKEGVLAVRILTFSKDAGKELKKVLQDRKFTTLLLDLRNNPGGLLDEAIAVVDLFVDSGKIVITRSRSQDDEVSLATEDQLIPDRVKVFVLIDEQSASASEIVASSLRDLRQAKILGRTSYGKGSVQSVIPLPNKQGGIKLTIARYFTQSEKMIDKQGVEPDVKYPKDKDSLTPVKNINEDKGLVWALGQIKKE